MRSDPSAVCAALAVASHAWPEQRTGQLILNALRNPRGEVNSAVLFNVEDHDLVEALMRYAGENVPVSDGVQGFSDGK